MSFFQVDSGGVIALHVPQWCGLLVDGQGERHSFRRCPGISARSRTSPDLFAGHFGDGDLAQAQGSGDVVGDFSAHLCPVYRDSGGRAASPYRDFQLPQCSGRQRRRICSSSPADLDARCFVIVSEGLPLPAPGRTANSMSAAGPLAMTFCQLVRHSSSAQRAALESRRIKSARQLASAQRRAAPGLEPATGACPAASQARHRRRGRPAVRACAGGSADRRAGCGRRREALEAGAASDEVILNILSRRREPPPVRSLDVVVDLKLNHPPIADCARSASRGWLARSMRR